MYILPHILKRGIGLLIELSRMREKGETAIKKNSNYIFYETAAL